MDGTTSRVFTAVALDARAVLPTDALRLPWPETRRFAYGRLHRVDADRELYVFHFGAVVVSGPDVADDALFDEVGRALGASPVASTRDSTRLLVRPRTEAAEAHVTWGAVEVGAAHSDLLATVALLLGQSAALERHERAADAALEETVTLAEEFAIRARVSRRTSELVRRVGHIAAVRLELARWFYVRDRPEVTWEQEDVSRLHDVMLDHLELKDRYASLLAKLAALEGSVQTVVGLWHARWGHRLEWAIVLLFVLDLVMVGVLAVA